MSGYEPYPEYRDSGQNWLGLIPRGWEVIEGKRAFKNRRESPVEGDVQLSASQKYGVVPQAAMMAMEQSKVMLALKGTTGFRHVESDDFVISLRSFEGGIEHSQYDGCVSPAYTVLAAQDTVYPSYFRYLFKSSPYISALQATTDSLRDGKSITYEQFGYIGLSIPSIAEQQKIANFLDHETAKIDTLIEKQQQLIKLLKEKRQAVISHAVTKGLNPDALMKDSGVEWLGEVPAGWTVTKLSNRFQVLLGKMLDQKKILGLQLRPYLRNTDVQWGNINTKDLPLMDFRPDEYERYSVTKGDLLVCEGGEIGRCALWEESYDIFYQKALHRLRPLNGSSDSSKYLLYSIFYAVTQGRFDSGSEKATIAHLPAEAFRRYKFTFPPFREQEEIASYLSSKDRIFELIERQVKQQVSLLKERRTALISAVVTGKIDVRNWQAPESTSTSSMDRKPL